MAGSRLAPTGTRPADPFVDPYHPLKQERRRICGAVGIEQPDARSALTANARIDESVGSDFPQLNAERLACRVVVWIERGRMTRIAASQIVQSRLDIEHDLAKLRSPPGGFVRARHEAAVVKDGLEQRDFEAIAGIENAIR